jgi:peptide/nickel transport system ATP-binding protein
MDDLLVCARQLTVKFAQGGSFVHAVNGVDFDLHQREVLCILGESGSGKSVTLRSLMRLNPAATTVMSGTLQVGGENVVAASESRMSSLRGRFVSMIFQDPMTSLDPVFTIGQQIIETIVRHEGVARSEARKRALTLLELVQIPSPARRLDAYPHELSGGLRQRAMIAIALSCQPKLLLADEPTTALDASVQIQILFLLREIQQELGMGMIFVTHDLGVAGEVADRVAVMYAGRFIEEGPVEALMQAPLHPYARGLLGATVHEGTRGSRLVTIPGAPPDLRNLPDACAFAPRCTETENLCLERFPDIRRPVPGRAARCIHVEDRSGLKSAADSIGDCVDRVC